jgi:uncharacterized membrane protein YgcG
MPPLNEQIADRITGGGLTEARTQVRELGDKYNDLRSETRKLSHQVETLKEGGTLAEGYADRSWDSRLALDRHWQQVSNTAQNRIIQKSDVDLYHDLMSYAYQYSPLIKAAVDIKTRYTFGLSFSIESEIDANKTLIDEIKDDPRNRHALFGAQAIAEADRELQKGGNVYLAIYIDNDPVGVRLWTSYEIGDVVLDPEDGDTPLYYIRSWTDTKGLHTAAYPSIFNEYPLGYITANGSGYTVDKTIIVYQMSEGRAAKQKWALSPHTSALPWNRAYEQFLLDFAAIVQIIRKYSTMFTTKGGEAQVSALSTQFSHEQHGHHQQQVGDGIIATEGNDFKVIDAGSGKIVGPQDSRWFLLQVCASTGVPENMITGNLQTGNRASAQEMTANFLPIIEERQTMWTETFEEVFGFVLKNRDFAVSFPPLRTQDALTYLQTLTHAATLGQPGKFAGTIRPEDFIRTAYESLDIEVPDDVDIDAMVQGIMDLAANNPDMATSLNNLTQATNQMNAAVVEMMRREAGDDTEWITVNGQHIPTQPGQSKGDAVKQAFGDKGGSGDAGGSSSKGSGSGGSDNSGGTIQSLVKEKGLAKKPSVVSKTELDKMITDGGTEVFRGVSKEEYANDFKTSETPNYGDGNYGSGYYFATGNSGFEDARGYSMMDNDGKKSVVMRGVLSDKVKTIDYNDIKSEVLSTRERFDTQETNLIRKFNTATDPSEKESLKTQIGKISDQKHFESDAATVAIRKGYNAISVPEKGYLVILDRSVVTVQDETIPSKKGKRK